MPTPSKPLVMMDKHLTNAEKNHRKQAEKELITGQTIKEWPQTKSNKMAHKHFWRIVSLYKTIGKNDALIESVLNRYCLIQAECEDFEAKREEVYTTAAKLREMLYSAGEDYDILVLNEAADKIDKLYKNMTAIDRQIQAKRKMLFDIERENLMTLAAQMRSIPKQPPEEEKAASGVAAFKKRRAQ